VGPYRILGDRQIDGNRSAGADYALSIDPTAVALDDGVGCSETKTGALADLLGRKKGLEHSLASIIVHADAIVRYTHRHISETFFFSFLRRDRNLWTGAGHLFDGVSDVEQKI